MIINEKKTDTSEKKASFGRKKKITRKKSEMFQLYMTYKHGIWKNDSSQVSIQYCCIMTWPLFFFPLLLFIG